MSLIFRLAFTILSALLAKPLEPMGESVTTFRVMPTDLDLNGHMNNGRYFTLMDLGRVDLMIRTRLAKIILKHHWRPVVRAETMIFKKALGPLDRYLMKTRVVCWDKKYFYLEQSFVVRGKVAASGIVQACFRDKLGALTSDEVLKTWKIDIESPSMPPQIVKWLESQSA